MKKDEFDGVYNEDVQRILLSHLIDDPDIFVRCRTIVKDEYFDDVLRRSVRFILSHADEHKAIPNPALIKAKTGTEIKRLSEFGAVMDQDWFLREIEQFCRHRALENIMLESYDLIQKGLYSNIEARVKEAMTISLVSDLGINYFGDPKERLRRMLDKSAKISTGWKTLDEKLYGGFERGGLNIFMGFSGSGKSLFLQNLALNWALAGYNVVYFTLELSEELVSLRLDSMLTGKSTKEVLKSVDDTSFMVTMKGKGAGSILIKKMTEGGTCTNDFRSYLKEYQIKTGLKPEAIISDYLDLMYPNNKSMDMSNLFVKDKFVAEELRGLMHETNTFGATASQTNRAGGQAQGELEQAHIGGGLSKINTTDNLFGINAPYNMKERGECELIMIKTRSSNAVGQRLKMKYDPPSMKISDQDEPDFEKPMNREQAKEAHKEQPKQVAIKRFPGAPTSSITTMVVPPRQEDDMRAVAIAITKNNKSPSKDPTI
jgi:hypothetical protein